ncbi:sensor histidine kinase [Stenomitos frigidus]|uniref:histidine kinase n=1 Tax=Stenomitos frigidus ULC18 TaxID=2107698 RepID=A0A2T1DTZ7_9CYAN|nr:ATP-binding protein [Stenomitos frigidus]PSB23983.1 hybrid sensor histidine kinase/response regulator [Stenomitos frigidus ULC18]
MTLPSTVNILLVDDHPENLLALEAVLGNLGATLVRANSGQEALRCLLNQDFAVILLDVQMPDMDGFETATLIRSRERSRQTPIIFLTAFSTSEQLMFKGYSLGAVDYLHKPINASILTSKVTVFVDLFRKTEAVKAQAAQLTTINAELSESEERFRSLSAYAPVGIFMNDTTGSCTYTNPCLQTIGDFTFSEGLGDGWTTRIHVDDRDRVVKEWQAYTNGHASEHATEYRFQHRDGNVRWVYARCSPLFSDLCELTGYVGTVEDLTERRQAEEARTQVFREQAARKEAEAANRMKDEFLAVLSHELRTPLNSMLGWSRLLRTRQLDDETVTRALETIERNALAQAQLIDDILDVSQIVRGKLRLQCQALNLAAVVEGAIESVRPMLEVKAIQLESFLDPAVGQVWGDSVRLQQVVWNLLTNAIKFTPANGTVTVRLAVMQSQLAADSRQNPSKHYTQISISDTGSGIHPEFLPHVFDRFRQADSTTSRPQNGLGLGLAIVRHLVEQHEGSVHAESEGVDQGSTFTVTLPLLNTKTEVNGYVTRPSSKTGATQSDSSRNTI